MKPISAKTKTLREINATLRQKLTLAPGREGSNLRERRAADEASKIGPANRPGDGSPIALSNVSHLAGLAAGLKYGEVIITSPAGDYLAALNAGATIRANQGAGNYAADNMTAGTVIIQGDAGFGTAEYCYGGTVVIYGNAGHFTATMNKGATIIVTGNVGDEVGTYMLKGNVVIVGNAGDNLANFLIRGSVFIGGEYQSLGENTRLVPMTGEDIAMLRTWFETYAIAADPARFRKIVAASEKPFYH